ncbi:MAG: hypothetical protein Q9218_000564 [Villophora microphyllina]
MCTWFCETFCCFLLRFQDNFHHRHDDGAGDDHLESGDSIYALPDRHRAYQQQNMDHPLSRPIELTTIYPGGSPSSPSSNPRPKRLPPRTVPRSVPLPVHYPPSETPTGKHFRFNKPTPNRMKPLPPLRTTFDGGGAGEVQGMGVKGSAVEKPTTSSSNSTSITPALTYGSAAPSDVPSTSAASVPNMGLPLVQELDKPFHVERQRGRRFNNGEAESPSFLPQRSRWVNTIIREDDQTVAD